MTNKDELRKVIKDCNDENILQYLWEYYDKLICEDGGTNKLYYYPCLQRSDCLKDWVQYPTTPSYYSYINKTESGSNT